jgi:tetratricopeptide (TPR) repeat protein
MMKFLTFLCTRLGIGVAFLAALAGECAAQCNHLLPWSDSFKACEALNLGVTAFKDAKYEEAVAHFKQAVGLDRNALNAGIYLATAYAAQYLPGGESVENRQLGQNAVDAFGEVLRLDPKNLGAIKGSAGILFNMREFEKAKEQYRRVAALDPNSPEAYFAIGNICWILCYDRQNRLPTFQRRDLIEEGMTALNRSLELDPNSYNSIFYINLLLWQKAQIVVDEILEDDPSLKESFASAELVPGSIEKLVKQHAPDRADEFLGYQAEADEMFKKAMSLRKRFEAKAALRGPVSSQQ